jgi:hypothetical protein
LAKLQLGLSAQKETSMRCGKPAVLALFGTSVLFLLAAASAQQVRFFPNFNPATSPTSALQLNGSQLTSFNGNSVLRLTPGVAVPHSESSTTFFKVLQPVNAGFTSWFQFQIHNATCCNPSDGLAFVVQNAATTDASYGAVGKGATARGVSNGGLGYAGIPNSVAIEFDTHFDSWDYTGASNHAAVQGCGTKTNGPVHDPNNTYTIYHNTNVKTCLVNSSLTSNVPTLGVTCGQTSCADGAVHDVVVEYAPVNNVWTLQVWVDPPYIAGTHTPIPGTLPAINIAYNIDSTQNAATGLSLATDSNGNKTSAFVGFTGSQSNAGQQQEDIIAWEFTPHTPVSVTQVIQPGCLVTDPACVPTTFTYGGHVMKVYYFQGFTNPNGLTMTVTATPTSRSQFYLTRLKGTQFGNEQCLVYLGTGGNCIVYSIKCSGDPSIFPDGCPTNVPNPPPATCNSGDPGCIVFSSAYYSADPVNQHTADFLSTDPIGSNNWQSIFLQYLPNFIDSGTLGGKNTGSDFVATFCVGAGCPLR